MVIPMLFVLPGICFHALNIQAYVILVNATNCDLHLALRNLTQTVLLDLDDASNMDLKTCIIQENILQQPMYIINKQDNLTDYNKRNRLEFTNIPNIVIISKELTPALINGSAFKATIRSHWNLLYFVATHERKYRCENSYLDENVYLDVDNFLNSVWHQYRIGRVAVGFAACKQKFVIYNGKRITDNYLYDRPTQLITVSNVRELEVALIKSDETLSEHYPLRANIFFRFPTAMTDCRVLRHYLNNNMKYSQGYCGLDGLVMHDIIDHYKFKLIFPNDNTCQNYGYDVSGNIAGSLGCIIRNELDISFNSRFLTMYSTDYVNFLHYVTTDSLCALTTQVDIIPLWHYVFDVYRIELWFMLLAALAVLGLVSWLLAIAKKNIFGGKPQSDCGSRYVFDSIILTLMGFTITKDRNNLILRGTALLCSIAFIAIYQGHVNHVFTTIAWFRNIETLDELYHSGETLYTSSTMRDLLRQIENPENELESKFINRSRVLPGKRIDYIVHHQNTVTLGRKLDTEIKIMLLYSDENGKPLIHIVNECFHTYYLSYIARAGFPFVEHLQLFMQRLNEAGLPKIYYKWTRRSLGLADSIKFNRHEARPNEKISLGDQRIAFAIILIGYVVSTAAFVVELWSGRHRLI